MRACEVDIHSAEQMLAGAGEAVTVSLPVASNSENLPLERRPTLRSLRNAAEAHAISRTLQETGWNRKRAAQLLSISYRGLLQKIRQYNLTQQKS